MSYNQEFNKQAFSRVMPWLAEQVGKKTFGSGFLAPVQKALGGFQNLYGYGQKGLAYAKNLNKPMSELDDLTKELINKGTANIAAGTAARQQASFSRGTGLYGAAQRTLPESVKDFMGLEKELIKNPLSYSAGRLLGGVTVGAPLFMAPATAAQYLGGATADKSKAEAIAKSEALKRIQQRTQEYADMPFLERLKTIISPQNFTQKIQETSPEALDLAYSAQEGINNPGIMKYLMSFHPFLGSSDTVLREKVRNEIMRQMGQSKQANAAGTIATKMPGVLSTIKNVASKAWSGGRAAESVIPKLEDSAPVWQHLLNKGVYNVAKNPVPSALAAGGSLIAPLTVMQGFGAGKDIVYDQAARDARALADLQFASGFGQEGLGGGLMRAIAALAPGLMQNIINKGTQSYLFGPPAQQAAPSGNIVYQ